MPSDGPSDRLTGWKEIASELGRSVRTVQRWEHDLGLPVHRIRTPAEGEIIYASRREIEAWLHRGASKALPSGSVRGRTLARFVLTLSVLIVGAAVVWLVRVPPPVRPAGWQIETSKITALSASGQVLWSYPFDFTLVGATSTNEHGRKFAAVEDLDGDGLPEVLFSAFSTEPGKGALYCFEHDGRVRFIHKVNAGVRFGESWYAPPFVVREFVTTEEPDGTRSVWVISLHHLEFPAVVDKLTSTGQLAGRYWHHGHLSTLVMGQIGERRVMFIGGTDNESGGAALSVVDFDVPTGSAPAVASEYRCTGCEATMPVAYLVFVPPELWRLFDHRPYVTDVQWPGVGELPVRVLLTAGGELPGERSPRQWTVVYRFSPGLDSVLVDPDDGYRAAHAALERHGDVRHSIVDDEFPVLRWSGAAFLPVPNIN